MAHTGWVAILLCTAASLALGLVGCGPEERHALRFDGLYLSDAGTTSNRTYWHYLRFAEQGTVVSVSSTVPAAEVAVWLHEPFESHGTWRIEEDVLRFSCTSPSGTVDYEGEVLQDGLQIRFHSHINDRRGERSYGFFAVVPDGAGP